MSVTTPADVAVAVCDWNGRLTWTSQSEPCCSAGTPIWEGASPESQETVKAAISRVVTIREPQHYDASNLRGEYFHVWLWPLNSPDLAVCLLSIRFPKNLDLLSTRERDCLRLLGTGCGTGSIAEKLDISLSTTHTHLKRARQKLGVETLDGLISYSARYCQVPDQPLYENSLRAAL